MTNRPPLLRLLAGAALLACASPFATADWEPDRVIVELAPGASVADINADYGTILLGSIESENIHLLDLPDGLTEDQAEKLLEDDPRIEDVEFNHEEDSPEEDPTGGTQGFFFDSVESDFAQQGAWEQIGAGVASGAATGSGVVVALLDTSVDVLHPHLADAIAPGGYDFVDDDADPTVGPDTVTGAELVAHGTFMAGLIAHVAPDATILPVRVLDDDGRGTSFRVAQGIYHAIGREVDVINLSLGAEEDIELIKDAAAAAVEAGIIVIAAAGNRDEDEVLEPAASDPVLGVASIDADDIKSIFSNYGGDVDLSAPGTSVVSLGLGGVYGHGDGTSIATSLVSGGAALVRSRWPALTVLEVRERLMTTAMPLDELNPDFAGALGAGRLDLAAALDVDEPLAGDLDGDGLVGFGDLLTLLAAWGPCAECPADLDGSGDVGFADLVMLISMWS
ncbi:MAG: S8 family serine peptidase [Phycisphaerales bacterium]|nr:S8 family serine peptidase [Phycisphaerae bacterium]NNM25665.1 S8 family serine peptidase [Phycisphaerales bacterium]